MLEAFLTVDYKYIICAFYDELLNLFGYRETEVSS